MEFEERHLDVLQNIEFAIISVYREDKTLADSNVIRALDDIIETYASEQKQREPRRSKINDLEMTVAYRIKAVCQWRLGRQPLTEPSLRQLEESTRNMAPEKAEKSLDTVLACLKRIRKSAQRWNKEQGRRGYLGVINRHIR